ncbi:ATP-binding protein [Ideonella sp. DXS22W]|uniref:histidine kinase n=1 Tax=Pseudaquabacterium inlustre TaxID=2984192 RepID=A0ABU9CBY9_9BURK
MTLRRTLLLALILLGLLPCIALSWLSFSRTREAMQAQIAESLAVQAGGLQADIDRMLFEHFENARVWSRSELMQDLRVGDVDKRVSHYLADLVDGYREQYVAMDCRDEAGRVLAATRPGAIGQLAPDAARLQPSLTAQLRSGPAQLLLAPVPVLAARRTLAVQTPVASAYPEAAPTAASAPVATAAAARVASAPALARLHLDVDVTPFERLLDGAAVGRRQIVVIDGEGRWVAASRGLRERALPSPEGQRAALARLLAAAPADQARTEVLPGTPWLDEPVILGVGRSRPGSALAHAGWTTLVLQPAGEALAPVRQMGQIFVGLLAVVLGGALAAATWMSGAIARPILALTQAARRWQAEGTPPDAGTRSSRITELGELGRAFDDMVRAVQRSRETLVRSAKLAMLGELAAVMAHEVRTPVGIVRSSAQLLQRDKGLSDDSRELLGLMQAETERLNRLVTTMLDTARPRAPSFQPCDVHALLQRCAQMQRVQPGQAGPAASADAPGGVPVRIRAEAADPVIEADAEQLIQALYNLMHNALQAVGPGGRVELSAQDDAATGMLVLACADDGPGIPPEIAERLFEPFVTRRGGGIGLGLAVVQQVVQAHGGQIRVGRSDWGGSLFECRLPRRQHGPDMAAGESQA